MFTTVQFAEGVHNEYSSPVSLGANESVFKTRRLYEPGDPGISVSGGSFIGQDWMGFGGMGILVETDVDLDFSYANTVEILVISNTSRQGNDASGAYYFMDSVGDYLWWLWSVYS